MCARKREGDGSPHSRGNGEGGGWVSVCARKRVGSAGTAGGWGVFMGEMVARGVEGMGPRIREETGGGRGNGGGLGGEGVLMGGMVARRGNGGWVSVCASARRGGTPILAFPREGGRERREGGGMDSGLRRNDGGGREGGWGGMGSGRARGHGLGSVGNNGRGAREGGRGFPCARRSRGKGDGLPHSRGNGRGARERRGVGGSGGF